MASKIVDQMKEKMKLAGQADLLAEMIPKRTEGLDPQPAAEQPVEVPASQSGVPLQQQQQQHAESLVTANLHLPLALRKQRRPNAGFTPHHKSPTKKTTKAVTVKQLKDELREQQKKAEAYQPPAHSASSLSLKRRLDRKKRLKMKKKLKRMGSEHVDSFRKKKKIRPILRDGKTTNDSYCWICHKEECKAICKSCPRVYHRKCLLGESPAPTETKIFFCPECEKITEAECVDTQSSSLASLSDDDLTKVLLCALSRMKHSCTGPFMYPVSVESAPNYLSYIFNPMDLSTLEENVRNKMYGSPDAFLADVKWIVHNCVIYNGSNNKLTKSAQLILQIAEHEIAEMQLCPDCYRSSCSKKKNWFCEPCRNLHTLVWAKLKGFPFWPAKVLREQDGRLDVRFFGQHDRAWVLVQDCYLISKQMPFPPTNNKTSGLSQAVREVEIHMQKIRDQNRECDYSPFRTPFDVNRTYAHRNVQAIKSETQGPTRGKKRKKKAKAMYVPILRDLDPPRQSPIIDIEINDEDTSTADGTDDIKENVGTDRLSRSENQLSPPSSTRDGNNVQQNHILKDSTQSSPEKDSNSGKSKTCSTPTSRFNVSRKVYSKSGKFLALASNIKEEVRSVVEWSPEDGECTVRKDPETSESATTTSGQSEVTGDVSVQKEPTDGSSTTLAGQGAEEKESLSQNDKSKDLNQADVETTHPENSKRENRSVNAAAAPLVLPNKLPDLPKIEVKTEELSSKDSISEGTQMTPQKNDKFNEKLNETIKSCRKFLGLESEPIERGVDSEEEESVTKSDVDSELDSSQDEEDDSKMESDDEETGSSRQLTPSSMAGGASPRLSRKLSGDFYSDSDDNGNTDNELVIDEDAGKTNESEASKEEEGEKGMQAAVGPAGSPKLTIKLPFGSKVKQKLSDTNLRDEDDSEEDDQDGFDGDTNVQEDGEKRRKVEEKSSEDAGTSSGDGGVAEMEQIVGDRRAGETNEGEMKETSCEIKGSTEIIMEVDEGRIATSGEKEDAESMSWMTSMTAKEQTQDDVVMAAEQFTKGEKAKINEESVESEKKEKAGVQEVTREIQCRDDIKDMVPPKESDESVIRSILNDLCDRVVTSQTEKLERKIAILEEELRQVKKKHMIQTQERLEMKATYELTVLEIIESRILLEDQISNMKKAHETELLEVKKKQWCAFCQKEAVFFCCWNTSYCDYPCQQKHWAQHQRVCQQAGNLSTSSGGTQAVSTVTTLTVNNSSQRVKQASGTQSIPLGQISQVTAGPGNISSPSLSNLVQYVRFMPMQTNQILQNLQLRNPQGPAIQLPSAPAHHSLGGSNPLTPAQVQTPITHPTVVTQQQVRPIGPPFRSNPTHGATMVSPTPQGNGVITQRISNGDELVLHIPQNIRMSVPT